MRGIECRGQADEESPSERVEGKKRNIPPPPHHHHPMNSLPAIK